MTLSFTDQELDYIYRTLIQRPMVEVEPLIIKIRQQVEKSNAANTPNGNDGSPDAGSPG